MRVTDGSREEKRRFDTQSFFLSLNQRVSHQHPLFSSLVDGSSWFPVVSSTLCFSYLLLFFPQRKISCKIPVPLLETTFFVWSRTPLSSSPTLFVTNENYLCPSCSCVETNCLVFFLSLLYSGLRNKLCCPKWITFSRLTSYTFIAFKDVTCTDDEGKVKGRKEMRELVSWN